MTPRLREVYDQTIVPAMTEEFSYANRLEVPRLDKIVINMGVGEASQDKKKMEGALTDNCLITKADVACGDGATDGGKQGAAIQIQLGLIQCNQR